MTTLPRVRNMTQGSFIAGMCQDSCSIMYGFIVHDFPPRIALNLHGTLESTQLYPSPGMQFALKLTGIPLYLQHSSRGSKHDALLNSKCKTKSRLTEVL